MASQNRQRHTLRSLRNSSLTVARAMTSWGWPAYTCHCTSEKTAYRSRYAIPGVGSRLSAPQCYNWRGWRDYVSITLSRIKSNMATMCSHLKDVHRTLASPPPRLPCSALAQKNVGAIRKSLHRAIINEYHTNELDSTARHTESTRCPLRPPGRPGVHPASVPRWAPSAGFLCTQVDVP